MAETLEYRRAGVRVGWVWVAFAIGVGVGLLLATTVFGSYAFLNWIGFLVNYGG